MTVPSFIGDGAYSSFIDERFMAQALSFTGEQSEILGRGKSTEIDKSLLINSHSQEYNLLNRISQMITSLYNIIDREEEEKKQIIQGLLSIYSGDAGPQIIDYLLGYGAATTYTLTTELKLSKQTISYNLGNLERFGIAKRKDQEIPDPRLKKRGPREKVWVLVGVSAEQVRVAVVKDLKLRNPERVRRIEEEDANEKEEKRLQEEREAANVMQEQENNNRYQSLFQEFLNSTIQKPGYPEIDTYLKTKGLEDYEQRSLHYRFRDSLKNLGRWN